MAKNRKVNFIDESCSLTFTQYTAIFECHCSYTNRSWTAKEQCILECPEHKKTQVAIHTCKTFGVQPEQAETIKSSLKVNVAALKAQQTV